MSKIIDVVTFNGEYDLFRLRYEMLKDVVDEFIVVEAPLTFSGKPKPIYSLISDQYFYDRMDTWNKVKLFVIDENDPELWRMARESPNTIGAEHWKREFVQKESIKKALTHLNDEDIVFIGDCDEIWDPGIIGIYGKLKLYVYTYWLNNLSSEIFYGTIVYPYKYIKNECLNHLRTNSQKDDHYNGWHFTSLAGGLERKLEDSYTSDSYANPEVMEHLDENIQNNKDFLGRDFIYRTDETNWPQYLKDNKEKYIHLCKQF